MTPSKQNTTSVAAPKHSSSAPAEIEQHKSRDSFAAALENAKGINPGALTGLTGSPDQLATPGIHHDSPQDREILTQQQQEAEKQRASIAAYEKQQEIFNRKKEKDRLDEEKARAGLARIAAALAPYRPDITNAIHSELTSSSIEEDGGKGWKIYLDKLRIRIINLANLKKSADEWRKIQAQKAKAKAKKGPGGGIAGAGNNQIDVKRAIHAVNHENSTPWGE